MYFPFVSRSRFDDMLREKNTQIGDRDRQIAELETDRRMLLDKLCFFGVLLFSSTQRALDQPKICLCTRPTAQPEGQSEPNANASGRGNDQGQPGTNADHTSNAEALEPQLEPKSGPPDLPSTNAEAVDVQSELTSQASDLSSPKVKAPDAIPGLKPEATDLHSPTANILRSRRLSFIMRRMNRLAERQYFNKLHPAKTAEQQREEAINQLNVAHMEAVKAGLNRLV